MIALRVTGLMVTYGPVVAVRDLDLTIEAGEALALLGPNGAARPRPWKPLRACCRNAAARWSFSARIFPH